MQCACAILSSVACPTRQYFSTLSHRRHDSQKNVTEHKICVLIFCTTFAETFLIVRSSETDIIKNVYYTGLYVKNPLLLSDFNEIGIFSTYFQRILKLKFYKSTSSGNRVVPWRSTDGQTDRHDEANSGFSQFCDRA